MHTSSLARALSGLLLVASSATTLAAGVIQSPTSAVVDVSGPGTSTVIEDTINQSGLSAGFTSGVTNFSSYLATNPTHVIAFDQEWFGNAGTSTAVVTYDMGSVLGIAALALWNEESSGIGTLNLFSSVDGSIFSPLASGLSPTDNPLAPYPAEVFAFTATAARFIRFDMSGCPQPDPGDFQACAIGEVAFDVVSLVDSPQPPPPPNGGQVPEPISLALVGAALAAVGAVRRRRNT